MMELLRTNDLVYLSFVRHVLASGGVDVLVLDEYTSAVDGSINAIPRRVMVADDDLINAQRLLGNVSLTNTP
jgi:hypothetical protein